MHQQSNDLRERLLTALPQPENLTNYREETAALLAKHAKALRWDKILAKTVILAAFPGAAIIIFNHVLWHLGTPAIYRIEGGTAFVYFVGLFYLLQYKIYESEIATLKEVKQIQLQILELQASLAHKPQQ